MDSRASQSFKDFQFTRIHLFIHQSWTQKGQFPVKPQLDIYNVVRSLVCMCLVKQFLSLSLSPSVVCHCSESSLRVAKSSRLGRVFQAGCRLPPWINTRIARATSLSLSLLFHPCSSLALAPTAGLSPSFDSPRLALAHLHVLSPPPLSRRSFSTLLPVSTFLLSLFTGHPNMSSFWPVLLHISYLGRVITCPCFIDLLSLYPRFLLTVFRIFFFFGLFSRLFQILVLFGRFIGPFSFSSTISLLSIFPFPFTFNLCEVFISCYLFFLFSSSLLLSFVYSFFIYHRIFEFSSFFCFSIHESLLEFLTSCSKQEERESNEHGVEFDMTSICRRVIRSSIIDKMEEKQNRRSISSYTYNCILSRFYVKILKVINKKFKQILDIYKLLLS